MVTVIIPVYNAGHFLQQSIDSVLSQTLADYELILVDDGSTDGSAAVCDRAAKADRRVRVTHKSNGGLSSARNAGLDMARGEFILFLDADDILSPAALQLLLTASADCDIVCSPMKKFEVCDASLLKTEKRKYRVRSFSPAEALEQILYQKEIDNSVCGKLYKASLWKSLRFREATGYEDLDITVPLMLKASAINFVDIPVYLYRQHPGSYLHTFSLRRRDVLHVTQRIVGLTEKSCPLLLPAARSRQLSANFNILCLISANAGKIPAGEREEAMTTALSCWQKIKELRGESLRNPSVRLKNKAAVIASYLGGRHLVEMLGKLLYR